MGLLLHALAAVVLATTPVAPPPSAPSPPATPPPPGGISATTVAFIILGIVLFVALIVLIYWCITRAPAGTGLAVQSATEMLASAGAMFGDSADPDHVRTPHFTLGPLQPVSLGTRV